jgi:glycosyltransferase involved in cell wall biosynthesis
VCDASRPDLSFFFPAWNEEEGIERAVSAAVEAGEALASAGEIERFEIVVVDDASTDSTPSILRALSNADPRVRTVRHTTNRMLGGAVRTGLAEARGELVLYTDADLPFDVLETRKAVRLLRHYDADIVAAYRLDRTGEGLRRWLYSYVYNVLVRSTFGLRLRDVNFAAKLVRRSVLDEIDLRSEGSFIDVELLAKAQRRGMRIIQFGVDYFPRSRGVSTLSTAPVIRKMLLEMCALMPEIARTGPRPRRQ